MDVLKQAIEIKIGLIILINRCRNSKKVIDILQLIAKKDGYIYNINTISRIALGHYLKY